ncbi:MAG: hypothetical protein RJQ10_10455, partial [Haliea sp.]
MKISLVLSIAVAVVTSSISTLVAAQEGSYDYDILIRSGNVVDGSGSPGYTADVGVRDGRIAFVGQIPQDTAKTIIDASGHIVAPGFIDSANLIDMAYLDYADMSITTYPDDRLIAPAFHQGVTTLVWGESGQLAPSTIRKFQDIFTSGSGLGVNVAFFVGHIAIRKQVMGMAPRLPTGEELDEMKALVREGMTLGALGLSTPLLVVPARYSDADELVALAKEVASFDGIFNSHFMRHPVRAPAESVAEIIDIGRRAEVPIVLQAIRAAGLRNKGLATDIIDMINQAHADGIMLVTGQYPYDGGAA